MNIVVNDKLPPGSAVLVSWTEQYMVEVSNLAVLQATGQISAGEATNRLDQIAIRMARENRVISLKRIGEPDATQEETEGAQSTT
jgi:hypothetical protein